MALAPLTPPPQPNQTVDHGGSVYPFWHEWFTRLWRMVNELREMVLAIDVNNNTNVESGTMVPYYIAPGDTFIVPIYKQALFAMTIDVEGILEVNGYLIQVE